MVTLKPLSGEGNRDRLTPRESDRPRFFVFVALHLIGQLAEGILDGLLEFFFVDGHAADGVEDEIVDERFVNLQDDVALHRFGSRSGRRKSAACPNEGR